MKQPPGSELRSRTKHMEMEGSDKHSRCQQIDYGSYTKLLHIIYTFIRT